MDNIIPPPPPLARGAFGSHTSETTSKSSAKNSTLSRINEQFQDSVWRHLLGNISDESSVIILCDFPSKLCYPNFHCQIFGLEDFNYFFQTIISQTDAEIIVITQHTLSLKNIIS